MKKKLPIISQLTIVTFILSLLFTFNTHAQDRKKSFTVNFTYPNGSTYNKARAEKDFGAGARWTDNGNTKIQNNKLRVNFKPEIFGPTNGFTGRVYIQPHNDMVMEYRIKFESDFDFKKGGKLPGFGGGTVPTGGKNARDGKGFSARSSWTKASPGLFNVYSYYVDQPSSQSYGDNWNSNFTFKANKWYTVKMEVRMNTGSNKNGFVRAYVDGKRVMTRNNIRLMTSGNEIDEVSFSIFMGGNNASFAPNHKQYLLIDWIKVYRRPTEGGPNGYKFAANEHKRVNVSGRTDIAFGANGKFRYLRNRTNNITCNSKTFGGDPIKGVVKKCYTRRSSSSSKQELTSKADSFEDTNTERTLKLFPNPVKNELNISLKNFNSSTIAIFGMNGQMVYQTESESELVNIPTKGVFAPGVYVIKVKDGDSNNYFQKVIIE